jgi:hypothetical protein
MQHVHILAESESGFKLLVNDILSSDATRDEGYKILENEHAPVELIIRLWEQDITKKFIHSLINCASLRENRSVQHKMLELLQIAPETIAIWFAPLCIQSDCNDCTDIIFDRFPLGFAKAYLSQPHSVDLLNRLEHNNRNIFDAIFKLFQDSEITSRFTQSADVIATMLLHTYHDDLAALITKILSHFHKWRPQHGSRENLAQLIADLIILYDLDINIETLTIDQAFAQAILQAKENLLKSYGYHNTNSINKIKKLISTELEKEALSRGVPTFSGARITEPTTQKAVSAISYIERKLIALGYNAPLITADLDRFCIRNDTTLHIDTDAIIQKYGALGLNAILSHEMAHYNGYHCTLRSAAAKDEHAARIYQEKFADIQACIHTGPEPCKALALSFLNSGVPDDPDSDEHAPAPVRAVTLLDLSRIQEEGTLDLDQPSPFTTWLETDDGHPDYNEFVERYFTCEDECKPGTRVIIAPHEAHPERTYYAELKAPYHHWMRRARGFKA